MTGTNLPVTFEKKMKYTDIIWDFNGTILDDVDAGIGSVNSLLSARGLPILESVGRYYELFGFPIIDYYRRLGFDFEKESYSELAEQWMGKYLEFSASSSMRQGVRGLLEDFRRTGLRQSVISMSEISLLKKQIESLGISDYFCELCGLDNIHAESKVGIAQSWRARHPEARALLIGDTIHDYHTACAVGADCLLVAGGHQPKALLAECGCLVVDDFLSIKHNI